MKSALVVAFLFFAYASADTVDIYLEYTKDAQTACAKEMGLPEKTPRETFDTDVKTGVDGATCLRACTMEKMGLLKDSTLVEEKMHDFVKMVHAKNPEMLSAVQKVTTECIETVKPVTDKCKKAFSFAECFLSKQ
ncbi:general odorant-binding protein 19d-like [Nomia melanderi]|uniref:general odorant-binding protein 19d-like n=1 Tax=Nomia melanderi TaxID=2448451 RepID=UPI0013042158|nr:uncharacterized protein LOC116430691 [Nomia melanderi]